jgi:hypothetical protein
VQDFTSRFRENAARRPCHNVGVLAGARGRWLFVLAIRLLDRSIALKECGQDVEAVAAAQEAVQVYRGLATTDPARYLPHLAASLNRKAILLIWLDRPGEALDAATEAADIYQNAIPASQHGYSAA